MKVTTMGRGHFFTNMAFFSKPKYSNVNVKSREGSGQGVWTKCPESGDMVFAKELKKNLMAVIQRLPFPPVRS